MASAEDISVMGKEPHYAGEQLGTEAYRLKLRDILRWNSYCYSAKDLRKFVVAYLKTKDANLLKEWQATGEKQTGLTACIVAKLVVQHKAPLEEKHQKWLDASINTAIALGKEHAVEDAEETDTAPAAPKLTIQDRLAIQLKDFLADIEDMEEKVLLGATSTPHEVLNYLKTNTVPQVSVPKIIAFFKPRLKELEEAQAGKCEQLAEGYGHYTKNDFKRVIAFYNHLVDDCNHYNAAKKVARVTRKKKPVAKEKVVAKVKYLKQDEALKIVSINPADIIGAQQLFVFNVKTRKLFRYIAEEFAGSLGIKGTTIIGFDENKSVGKTLRKPAEQLAEFKKAGKVQLRKFLDEIKAVEVKGNGRLNEDTVLLKVL